MEIFNILVIKSLMVQVLYIFLSVQQSKAPYTYKSSKSGDSLVTLSLVAFWDPSSTTNGRYTYDDASISWHMQLTTIYVSIPCSTLKLLACLP